MSRAIGYVRQSARRDLELALSPEQQREEVRRLAARDGYPDVEIVEDLGRSGGKGKERRRKAYQAIISAVESMPSRLYAKALSRLGAPPPAPSLDLPTTSFRWQQRRLF
jgi:DNA invertase Pin-like site-specific DNA recombinase